MPYEGAVEEGPKKGQHGERRRPWHKIRKGEPPAWPQDSVRFSEEFCSAGKVIDALNRKDDIKRPIREGKAASIAPYEPHHVPPTRYHMLPGPIKLSPVDIESCERKIRTTPIEAGQSAPDTTSDIQNTRRISDAGGITHPTGQPFGCIGIIRNAACRSRILPISPVDMAAKRLDEVRIALAQFLKDQVDVGHGEHLRSHRRPSS
jgi:hypothetical protein